MNTSKPLAAICALLKMVRRLHGFRVRHLPKREPLKIIVVRVAHAAQNTHRRIGSRGWAKANSNRLLSCPIPASMKAMEPNPADRNVEPTSDLSQG